MISACKNSKYDTSCLHPKCTLQGFHVYRVLCAVEVLQQNGLQQSGVSAGSLSVAAAGPIEMLLAAAAPNEQKHLLGERLYPLASIPVRSLPSPLFAFSLMILT